jgi:esterase/lipase superfamily enzyme
MAHARGGAEAAPVLVRCALAALACLLAACAGRPKNVLLPIGAAPPDASVVSMLAVSTRAPSPVAGEVYSGRRGLDLSMARIEVSVPVTHHVGRIEWPEEQTADPATEFATVAVTPVDAEAVRAWFRGSDFNGHVLIFVHGFNVPFDGAVYRLAQLVRDAQPTAAPVLFTWPSLGSTFAYVYDRESAAYSRDALEAILRLAAESSDVTDITILAHSMGTWLTMEALRQYAIRSGRVDPKISNVIMASPDLDADVFRLQFNALGEQRPNFTFLIARDDRALMLSRLLAAGVTRVGAADVMREPWRSALDEVEGVTVVDMTALGSADRTNHLLFAESPEAVRLLSTIFVSGGGDDPSSHVAVGARLGAAIVVLAQTAASAVDVGTASPQPVPSAPQTAPPITPPQPAPDQPR